MMAELITKYVLDIYVYPEHTLDENLSDLYNDWRRLMATRCEVCSWSNMCP